MKKININGIFHLNNSYENNTDYEFSIPSILNNFFEIVDINYDEIIDIKDLTKDSPDFENNSELELNIVRKAINNSSYTNKIHLHNISLVSSILLIEDYYRDLGFFNSDKNSFDIDFKKVNLTVSIDFFHLLYSLKDSKTIDKKYFNSDLKSPSNTKVLIRSCNSGSVLGINFNNHNELELQKFIKLEKISIYNISKLLNFSYMCNNNCEFKKFYVKI